MTKESMKSEFEREGMLYISKFFSDLDLQPVWKDVADVTRAFGKSVGLTSEEMSESVEFDRLLVKILKIRPELQSALYDRLQVMPALLALAAHPKISALARDVLNANEVGVWPRMQLRFDKQYDEKNLIGWHTDYLYNQGTKKSVTFWMPIVPISSEMGLLLFARQSHKRTDVIFQEREGGRRFVYDLDQKTLQTLDIFSHKKYEAGDLVLFHSQFIHSGQINEDPSRARLTVLFRMQDINELEVFNHG